MRRLPVMLSLMIVAFAGCKTPGGKQATASARPRVVAAASEVPSKPAESEPRPPSPPPAALAVARSVSPESTIGPNPPSFAIPEEELAATPPPANLPRQLQTCPVDPLLNVLSGSRDPQAQQDALNVVALMLATGTVQALRASGGGHSSGRKVAGSIDDVIQTDDDQSSVSKQMRPAVLFTLGWKY